MKRVTRDVLAYLRMRTEEMADEAYLAVLEDLLSAIETDVEQMLEDGRFG